MYQGSDYVSGYKNIRVLNVPLDLIMSGSEYARVLNMPLVLNMAGS